MAGLVLAIGFANRNHAPVGSDDQAENMIKILRPNYHPIAKSIYVPGPVAESILFVAQGAGGVAILWWALYSLRKARRQTGERIKRHLHLHPHLSDIAFTNHWRHRNPWEKVLFGGGFLAVALIIPPMPGAIVIAVIVSLAAIAGARIPASSWLTVLSIPVSFAILTAVGIMIQIGGPGPGFPVSIDWSSLPIATGLLLRSTAAISCLAFIGWTTPLMELIPVFGRIGIPNVLIDLALMIYHFLFVTATTLREMRRAQSWRMGRADYRSRMRALSMLAGGLFIRCIERFRRLEDGIQSRGYEGRLWVLAPERGASFAFIGGTLALQAFMLAAGLVLWKGASMDSILEARNVSFAYGPAKWALQDLSFTLPKPERVCLLGSNGVGKSTLMLLLNGTLKPQQGELFVLGEPIDYSRAGLHKLRRRGGDGAPGSRRSAVRRNRRAGRRLRPFEQRHGFHRRARLGRRNPRGASALLTLPKGRFTSSAWERRSASPSPESWCCTRKSFCWTSQPPASTSPALPPCWPCSKNFTLRARRLVISTHDTDLAYEWANEAWVLGDGRVAAQGPIGEVMKDCATLHQAHLKVPWVVELGLAIHDTYPELGAQPLPATEQELILLIQQIRLASAV